MSTTPSNNLNRVLLSEYDGMVILVALLKEEQRLILSRTTEPLMLVLTRIEEQLSVLRDLQGQRETALSGLIPVDVLQSSKPLAEKISHLPDEDRAQSMDVARRLDREVAVVRELTWQNHVLLSHSVNFLEQVLAPLLHTSTDAVTVYGKNGAVQKTGKRSASLQAVA